MARRHRCRTHSHPFLRQAVCSFDGDLTYEQLDREAIRLAAYLVRSGVRPEVPVALCMDKGKLVIVALLAVLKAGGVCVCFNLSQPQKRLENLVISLQTQFVLATAQHLHRFEGLTRYSFCVSEATLESFPSTEPGLIPCAHVQPNNAAVIIYTSGSTGTPKGVVLEHRSLATSSRAHGIAMGIGLDTRVLQFASFLYDVFIQDIFTTLQRGGTVCMISENERYNNLAAAIDRTRANSADLTSSVAALLEPDRVPALKRIILGGEPMKPEVSSKWERRKDLQVFNAYGPAECSVTSTLVPFLNETYHRILARRAAAVAG